MKDSKPPSMKDTKTPSVKDHNRASKVTPEKLSPKGQRAMQAMGGGEVARRATVEKGKGGATSAETKATQEIGKAQIELHRPNFRPATKEALRQAYPDQHWKRDKPRLRQGFDRRHVISSGEMKAAYEKAYLNKSQREVADMLKEKNVHHKDVNQGAQKLYADAFNDPKNVWVGDATDNRTKQTDVDYRPYMGDKRFAAHKAAMQKKYFWPDSKL